MKKYEVYEKISDSIRLGNLSESLSLLLDYCEEGYQYRELVSLSYSFNKIAFASRSESINWDLNEEYQEKIGFVLSTILETVTKKVRKKLPDDVIVENIENQFKELLEPLQMYSRAF